MLKDAVKPSPTTAQILTARPPRIPVDPFVPYAFIDELERSSAGLVENVSTIFLSNRECPFHCLMCDLWQQTLSETVPSGAIPAQVDYALSRLPLANHIKLYNSGNFFDPRAIPEDCYADVANRLALYQSVIVENHPAFVGDRVLRFRDLLPAQFEVAMGLETVHPEVLPRLNKQMSLDQFSHAADWLVKRGMFVRAFVLLQPTYMAAEIAVDWAVRATEFAANCGARVVSIIPTRGGNGIMEELAAAGDYTPPRLSQLEEAAARCLSLVTPDSAESLRIFVDTWNLDRFARCPFCAADRIKRLDLMNLEQRILPDVLCPHCGGSTTKVT